MADYGDDARKASEDHLRRCLAARRVAAHRQGSEECVNCGERIPERRRSAMPGCVLCVDCQAEEECYGV